MEHKPKSCVIKFTVTGIPDTAGLRIRLTDKIGIYISSIDPLAAQKCFEILAVEFAVEQKILITEGVAGFKIKEDPDWNSVIISGQGEIEVIPLNFAVIKEMLINAVPKNSILKSPWGELETEWWENPNGGKFCIARDKGGKVDSWLLEEVFKDLKKTNQQ